MEASRRQPGMLEGLSRFLIQHERCGAGFDVAHPAGLGSGRVSITCRGCGARHEYATATIEFERELKIETTAPPAQPPSPPRQRPTPAIPPRPAPYPDLTQPPAAEPPAQEPERATRRSAGAAAPGEAASGPQLPRRTGTAAGAAGGGAARRPGITAGVRRRPAVARAWERFWHSPRATTTLFVIAAVALGFGVVRLLNSGGSSNQGSTQQAPNLSAPTATAPTAPTAPAAPVAPTTTPQAAPQAGLPSQPATVTLRTRHFTIAAPAGWTEHTASGGLLLQPPAGGHANVQVYFQRSPGLSAGLLANQTADFLRREVPGARLSRGSATIAGARVVEQTARGPGETAVAVDVLRGPYRYLVIRRIFAGAKPHTSRAASQAVSSFTPR
jgi:hypothetical protein